MNRKRFTAALFLACLLMLTAGGAYSTVSHANRSPAPSDAAAAAVRPGSGRDSLQLGVKSEGTAAYEALIGRLAAPVALFGSTGSAPEAYFIFPAPARRETVEAARYYLLERSGSYGGNASLSLEVRGLDGSLLRTISTETVDMESAPVGAWNSFALAAADDSRAVLPGEVLVAHFALDGRTGDDFEAQVIFDIDLSIKGTEISVPLVVR